MDKNITDWLLEGPAWIKYAVELQLLGKKFKADNALNDGNIKKIINILKSDQGIPALKTGKITYQQNIYWYLYFLADIGFNIRDIGLEKEAEMIYNLQTSDGKFITMNDMKPDFFCIPTILLYSLKNIDFKDKGKLDIYINHFLESMRLDGGWHCAKQRAVGQKLQDTESCPMDNQNILMLLSCFDKYRKDSRFNGAIDLLLNHWQRRKEKWRPYGFGIGTDFKKLRYPAVKYGILRILDILSMYPYAVKSKAFKEMMAVVKKKAVEGRYFAESTANFFSGFDFGQKKEPSRWITFLVYRIENRVNEI